ncbi:response regulator transcription factor, partial [Actinocorallia lasiicapitis]
RRDDRAQRRAETAALEYLAGCEDADTPPLRALGGPDLTARQWEVVRLAAENLTNREIADRLSISKRTVDNHLTAVYERAGLPADRSQLHRLLKMRRQRRPAR